MKTYKIGYIYDGKGEVLIQAKSEAEARELFLSGEWEEKDAEDDSDNYCVEAINEIEV